MSPANKKTQVIDANCDSYHLSHSSHEGIFSVWLSSVLDIPFFLSPAATTVFAVHIVLHVMLEKMCIFMIVKGSSGDNECRAQRKSHESWGKWKQEKVIGLKRDRDKQVFFCSLTWDG
jgi:hypothetical protein